MVVHETQDEACREGRDLVNPDAALGTMSKNQTSALQQKLTYDDADDDTLYIVYMYIYICKYDIYIYKYKYI